MKTTAFCRQNHIQCKLLACSCIIQQISNFTHPGCNFCHWCTDDINVVAMEVVISPKPLGCSASLG